MILAANQPYFLPYLGYWQLINVADVFLICDDYNYIKKGWIARNKLLLNNKPHLFSLPISNRSQNSLISEMFLLRDTQTQRKLMKLVYQEYHRAPYFKDGYSLFCDNLLFPQLNLVDYLENSIKTVCKYIGVSTPLRRTSEFHMCSVHGKQYRIFDYCHSIGADTYINAIGGQQLYDKKEFADHGISLKFLKSDMPPYQQFNNEFVSGLSILDTIMFCSKEEIQEMLNQYTLI